MVDAELYPSQDLVAVLAEIAVDANIRCSILTGAGDKASLLGNLACRRYRSASCPPMEARFGWRATSVVVRRWR